MRDAEKESVQPHHTSQTSSGETGQGDASPIDFEADDAANPVNWSLKKKWSILILISLLGAVVQLATVMCAPTMPQVLQEFNSDNQLYLSLTVSIWELGEVVGPLIIAPLSELYGRLPVLHGCNILFIIFSAACALSQNIHMLIAFRFLNGASVASITLRASIVGDLFIKEERGRIMSYTGLAPMLGPVAGPIIGSYLGKAAGWRWTFWFTAIFCAALGVPLLFVFQETYKVRILQQRANQRRKKKRVESTHLQYAKSESKGHVFRKAIIRPLQLLFFSPVVFLLSLYVSVVYGYLYLVLTTITEVFEDTYNFSERSVGLTFLGLGIGMTTGIFLCRFTLDVYVRRHSKSRTMTPEQRLPPIAIGGLILPAGLFMYGWTAQTHVHWIAPIIGTGILGFGLTATTIPASNYLVDAFEIYAASAIAANIVMRNIFGAILPLAGPPLYKNLGLGWGNSILGFIALLFIPVPVLLMYHGARLRRIGQL